jgi:hypothetical protein
MTLGEKINDPKAKPLLVADCCTLVDEEVASKGGISGFAVKAGYGAVKSIKPGFIAEVVDRLLPEFVEKLDPIWADAEGSGKPVDYFLSHKSQVAEALLSVTDGKVKEAKSSLVRGTYDRLRGSAKKNVEEAVPRLARVIQKHS